MIVDDIDGNHDFRYCQCNDCQDLFALNQQWRMDWEDHQYEKNGPRHEF